jgi:cell division protein FtsN
MTSAPPDTAASRPAPASAPAPAKAPPKETAVDKAPVTKAPAGSGLYYVQVAAFTDKTQAQAVADKYKKQGYTASLSPRATSTKTWYRVRLGGSKSRDQAVDLLAKLNAAAGKKTDYQIVRD